MQKLTFEVKFFIEILSMSAICIQVHSLSEVICLQGSLLYKGNLQVQLFFQSLKTKAALVNYTCKLKLNQINPCFKSETAHGKMECTFKRDLIEPNISLNHWSKQDTIPIDKINSLPTKRKISLYFITFTTQFITAGINIISYTNASLSFIFGAVHPKISPGDSGLL